MPFDPRGPAAGAARRAVFSLALLAAAGMAPGASAAPQPQARPVLKGRYASVDKLPDWSGVWENISGIHLDNFTGSEAEERARFKPASPPYNTEYAAKYRAVLEAAAAGRPMNDPTANCLWPGMPRLMWQPYPLEFVFEPGMVRTNHEYMSQIRRIFTDGRGHPAELDASFNGHSIGHWERDTLVVDTVGLKPGTMFQNTGMPHSDALSVEERIRLIAPDILEDELTMIDPKAFTGPYVTRRHFRRRRDWEVIEYVCEENNRNPSVAGVTQVLESGK
jgi:hypothetical protein